jgi:Xaa-Pro aminopeptidase
VERERSFDRRFMYSRCLTFFQILISPQTSYAISLMLTHFRYTVAPSIIEEMIAIKNETELEGMRRAFIRDGVAFVRPLAFASPCN